MISDDLAPLLQQDTTGTVRWGQAVIRSYDPADNTNTVELNGGELRNLTVLGGPLSPSFQPGQTVMLLGLESSSRRGVTQWFILGRLIVPGGTEDSQPPLDTISARTINVDELNAEQINIEGQTVGEAVEEAAPPPVGTIKVTYNAAWSANYKGNGSKNTFDSRPHQGFWSLLNGNQRSLIGFPSSTIQSDHSGRTITRVRVYLYFAHWYFNSGGTAIIGHHGHNSAPSSFSASADEQRVSSWPKPGGRWVTYTHTLSQWGSGTKRGIALGPGPSTSRLYYGRARGVDEAKSPRLEIVSDA